MFHSGTERLIEYWRDRCGADALPARAAIDPCDFPELLPQVFMLGRDVPGQYPFRLAGGFVAALHARDLRGVNALSLWAGPDQAALQVALERARSRPEPIVVFAEMCAEGVPGVSVEVLFAPLAAPSGAADRFLGLYQPTGLVHRLKERPLTHLALRHIETASHGESPRLRLAFVNGRQLG